MPDTFVEWICIRGLIARQAIRLTGTGEVLLAGSDASGQVSSCCISPSTITQAFTLFA